MHCSQASAVGGVVAGNVADWLQEVRGWKAVRVRAFTQTLATLGGPSLKASALLPDQCLRPHTAMLRHTQATQGTQDCRTNASVHIDADSCVLKGIGMEHTMTTGRLCNEAQKLFMPAGPALSLLPFILFRTRTPMSLAVGCLAAFMGLQAFCYAGFHAYVQVMLELIHVGHAAAPERLRDCAIASALAHVHPITLFVWESRKACLCPWAVSERFK